MNQLTITTIASLFLCQVLHAEVPIKRGATTCKSAGECSFQKGAGRLMPATTETMTDNLKLQQGASPAKTRKQSVDRAAGYVESGSGNLPAYYNGVRHAASGDAAVVIVPEKSFGALLPGLRAGDILQAEIEQSVKASPSVPTPIRARVTAGRFHGAYVLGVATLDKELKRVLLDFTKIRIPGTSTTYNFKGTGLALSGQVGLEGDHHTQEGTYFAAELGSAAAAGYVDATTTRSQTLMGTYQTEPSATNAAKQGAVNALSKSAERFAERARTAPEYTEIEGGRTIQIILNESPTEENSI